MEYCFDPSIKWHYDCTMTDYFLSHQKRMCSYSFLFLLPLLPIENVDQKLFVGCDRENTFLFFSFRVRNQFWIRFGNRLQENRSPKWAKNTFFIDSFVIDEQTKLNTKTFFLRRNFLLVPIWIWCFPIRPWVAFIGKKIEINSSIKCFFHLLWRRKSVCMQCKSLFGEMIFFFSFSFYFISQNVFFCYFGLPMA